MEEVQKIEKQVLIKNNISEVKVLMIKCIEGIAANKTLVPEVAHYNTGQKLCDLFNHTKDKIIRWIALKLLAIIAEAGLIIDLVYRTLNIESLIVSMNIDKDVELARVCFNLMHIFSTNNKLQHSILSNIPRMKKYVFECLSDETIKGECKVE
jgi:cytochrome b subunit of formate dehydrogenase